MNKEQIQKLWEQTPEKVEAFAQAIEEDALHRALNVCSQMSNMEHDEQEGIYANGFKDASRGCENRVRALMRKTKKELHPDSMDYVLDNFLKEACQ